MEWLRDHLWETWLGVAILLGVAELFSLDLFLAMLAAGALGGVVTALVTDVFAIQALVAAVVSIGMLAVVRPSLARRLHGGEELKLGNARLVGLGAVVIEPITAGHPGRVKLDGEVWSASAEQDLRVGDRVEVTEIRGATAVVRPRALPGPDAPGAPDANDVSDESDVSDVSDVSDEKEIP